jgi:hypothetical protein
VIVWSSVLSFHGDSTLTGRTSCQRYSVPAASAAPGAPEGSACAPTLPVRNAIRSVETSSVSMEKVKSGSPGTFSTMRKLPVSRMESNGMFGLFSPADWMRSMTLLPPTVRMLPARMDMGSG